MTAIDIPTLGTLLLGLVLVSAAYTFAVSVAAAGGRPHLLRSARFGTFATVALVACAVFLLAYAFQAHDFRIRYVARYSDRSMPAIYLWTALWGGQDGSLLWWTFLSSLYIAGFTWWVKGKFREMQPTMFATLMSVIGFFVVLQLFAANPFQTSFGGAPADGEGLNPLLQNYWMAIHPPALYLGLTGWAVPFAFVVGALVTGRLGEAWIRGARKWVLLAWGFLTLGNLLGMFWSYEELGWGGYWAWDPVENASFLPWLTATAYVHSVMIQERRGTFRVWNVFLLSMTFILTIFGTFLTRSGLIASVHSFARSDIGIYFAWYLIGLCLFVVSLIGWRLPDLRNGRRVGWLEWTVAGVVGVLGGVFLMLAEVAVSWVSRVGVLLAPVAFVALLKGIEWLRLDALRVAPQSHHERRGFESLLSREFAYLVNNWILLGMAVFVLLATTFPLISEWLRGETVTVGPDYYNYWMVPLGLVLLFLTGVGPLIAWRKATGRNLLRAFRWPALAAVVMGGLHLTLGSEVGFPAFVEPNRPYETLTGQVLGSIYSVMPLLSGALCAFVLAAIVQEFVRGAQVRRRSKGENWFVALFELVARARRRYGGYVVHFGIVLLFFGFTGAAYDLEEEASLLPGETMEVGEYDFRYERVVMDEDPNKRMIYTDLTVLKDGSPVARVQPAKYVYRSHPEMPTTEVSIHTTSLHNLYVIMSAVDPQTHRGTFRIIKQPLVLWIWLGGFFMLLGVGIAIFPKISELVELVGGRQPSRAGAAVASALLLLGAGGALSLTPSVASAQSDSSSSLHAGTVVIRDPEERRLFSRLLCECGDCQRLPLHTCGCSWAEGMRAELRGRMERGDSVEAIIEGYRDRFGAGAIAIPSDEGLDRALWAVPITAIVLAAGGLIWRGRRWARAGEQHTTEAAGDDEGAGEYDDRLEEELRSLEGD
ncbi:MAG TPA: cytochrome c-type biogenesis CcmF C-terminal domain-containing protein [Sandaracinaceae bacterium LLY-WYZ-13_1]|nr:cytochrome c-type biogenesis CcmF C-terminal domain-containing protein [Sandaracinaceae bacterium LLY-WYZ-13_1]